VTAAPLLLGLLAGQAALLGLAPFLAQEATAPPLAAYAFVAIAIALGLVWLAGRDRLAALPFAAVLLLFAALRLPWLAAPAVLDTDHLRFIWDGQLVLAGLSPWGPPPAAGVPAALGAEGEALAARLPFAGLRSIYPGVAQAVFALGQALTPWEATGLRLLLLAADLAALLLLRAALRRAGLPEGRAALWAACPLLPVLVVGGAHPDALLPPLILGAVLAAASGRGLAAGALLGLAVGVKVWPLLLAPLLARALPRAAWPVAAGALTVVGGGALLPVALSALSPDAGLAAYAGGWSANNAPFAWAQAALGAAGLPADALLRPLLAAGAGVAALWAALAVAGGARPSRGDRPAHAPGMADGPPGAGQAVRAAQPATARASPTADAPPGSAQPARATRPAPAEAGRPHDTLPVGAGRRDTAWPRLAGPAPGLEPLLHGALLVGAVTFYLSPAQFPWYMLWFLPFAVLLWRAPLLLPAALLPLYYLWVPLRDAGLGAVFAHGVAALHLLPVLLWLALERRR
jgi:alpha-1,6-mannosyltransferase